MTRRCERPYDAEVEYLEVSEASEGQPWIDTEFVPKDFDIYYKVDMQYNGILNYKSGSTRMIGAYTDVYIACYRIATGPNDIRSIMIQNGNLTSGIPATMPITLGERLVIESFPDNSYIVNDVEGKTTYSKGSNNNTSTFKIFLNSNQNGSKALIKVYSFVLKKADKLIFDMIPVRKGNEGYLYNKVDGKLYGNVNDADGSHFLLGPDIG